MNEPISFSLTDAKIVMGYKDYIDYIVRFDVLDKAYGIVKALPLLMSDMPNFQASYPELYKQYEDVLIKAKATALPFLPNEETIEFLSEFLGRVLDIPDYNVVEKVRAKILRILVHTDRDVYKQELLAALFKSISAVVAQTGLTKTVGEILRDYKSMIGEEPADAFMTERFLAQLKGVDQVGRGKIRQLFDLYNYISKPSTDPEGLDEYVPYYDDEGRKYVYKQGRLETVEDKTAEALFNQVRAIRSQTNTAGMSVQQESGEATVLSTPVPPPLLGSTSAKEVQEVANLFQTIGVSPSISFGTGKEGLVRVMLRALSNKKQIEVQAYLKYFALSGELPDVMLNPEIMKTFKPYLERKMGQAAALAYTSKPKRPAYVKLFLQWVFEDQLGMTPEESRQRIEPIVKILAVDDPEFISYTPEVR